MTNAIAHPTVTIDLSSIDGQIPSRIDMFKKSKPAPKPSRSTGTSGTQEWFIRELDRKIIDNAYQENAFNTAYEEMKKQGNPNDPGLASILNETKKSRDLYVRRRKWLYALRKLCKSGHSEQDVTRFFDTIVLAKRSRPTMSQEEHQDVFGSPEERKSRILP
uniref:Uncharacterized protein n=1 Tax=Kwoniella pini CBS 10737 TaxID=1296096 RepID=A0A1B9HU24_9TREE|nr:uncharacterized protein I206_07147 [Kwoniella pini CBS 10737]OCF46760.1 hypothetical protein I206_07147 [Kwoniella pini CBS 10737]